jgi:ATP-dependent DNA helicase RecG
MPNTEILKAGEGPRLAFMETADANKIAETLVAFANTEGGMIIIGLQPDGKPSSSKIEGNDIDKALQKADDLYNPPVVIEKWEELPLDISDKPQEANSDKISPKESAKAETNSKDTVKTKTASKDTSKAGKITKDVAKVEVKSNDTVKKETASKDKKSDTNSTKDDSKSTKNTPPVQKTAIAYAIRVPRSIELHALSDGRVLIRSGKTNRPLGGQEILRLASAKNTGDFESDGVPGATKDDFSRKMIDEYLEKRAERTKRPYNGEIDDLLVEIGALTREGNPTVSGILLFSEYPQQWLPQSGVVFAKFIGTTPRGESGLAGYSRREELTGPVPRLIEATWNLVWSEMAVSAVVKGLEREETFEYPQFAVREALVNAICHRDYRLRGRRIEVRMFSDRLEVISPGGLPGFITVENIKDEHFSRNPRLVNGLFQWGYIEELGLGIDRMMEVMEQAGHQPPKFDARPYSFAVTLHNERKKPKPPEWTRNTNHRQARALQYIRESGSITNREYRTLIQGVSAETLRLDLADMVEKGILIKVGSKKGTYYILK